MVQKRVLNKTNGVVRTRKLMMNTSSNRFFLLRNNLFEVKIFLNLAFLKLIYSISKSFYKEFESLK